jgi:hypothetical protein
MKTLLTAALVIVMAATTAIAAPPKAKKKTKAAPPEILTLGGMEVGQTGILAFPTAQPVTLLPLKIEAVDENQFVGSLTSSMTGKRTALIVRGVKTEGLVSGRYFQLNGIVKVAETAEISDGQTVFVLEPVDPETFTLKRSDSPELERPR